MPYHRLFGLFPQLSVNGHFELDIFDSKFEMAYITPPTLVALSKRTYISDIVDDLYVSLLSSTT